MTGKHVALAFQAFSECLQLCVRVFVYMCVCFKLNTTSWRIYVGGIRSVYEGSGVHPAAPSQFCLPHVRLLISRFPIAVITCSCYYQFHSEEDAVVPFSLGQRLWNAVAAVPNLPVGCKTFVVSPTGRHNKDIRSTQEIIEIPKFFSLTRNLASQHV